MKQQYEKPQLMMEDFRLSENIAACGGKFGNHIDWINSLNGFFGYFGSDLPELTCGNGEPPEGFELGDLCYHTSANNVFAS